MKCYYHRKAKLEPFLHVWFRGQIHFQKSQRFIAERWASCKECQMKVLKQQYKNVYWFAVLFLSTESCHNHGGSGAESLHSQYNNDIHFIESKVDSMQWLNFTNGVRSILEDSKGNVWLGSHKEGVARFDGKEMTYFTQEDGLSDNQVRSIFEDSSGMVWFECGKGLSSYYGQRVISHVEKNYNAKKYWQTNNTDLWFKGDEAFGFNELEGQPGVYRYDGHALSFHVFPISPPEEEENPAEKFLQNGINTIAAAWYLMGGKWHQSDPWQNPRLYYY